jgi:hypothetical protein
MTDLLFLLVVFVFFASCFGLIALCAKLEAKR